MQLGDFKCLRAVEMMLECCRIWVDVVDNDDGDVNGDRDDVADSGTDDVHDEANNGAWSSTMNQNKHSKQIVHHWTAISKRCKRSMAMIRRLWFCLGLEELDNDVDLFAIHYSLSLEDRDYRL